MIRPRFGFGLRRDAIRPATSSVAPGVSLFSLADRAPDAALISALALNDEAAAVAFVRRFQGPVFGLAVSITRDRALAEDIAQEAFLRAWRAAGSYDVRRGSVLTWLLTITRNLAIDAIRARRSTLVESGELELLVTTTLAGGAPDGTGGRVEAIVAARPDVYNHNLETVPRLYPTIRPGARYYASLRLLETVKRLDPTIFTKSGVMVGLGEERMEIHQVMDDMRSADIDFLTMGQYLQPTPKHAKVAEFVTPKAFDAYGAIARSKGFLLVAATPLTRSSYHAGADFAKMRDARNAQLARTAS